MFFFVLHSIFAILGAFHVAFNAPHSPFQAHPEDIARYAANPKFAKDRNNLTDRICGYSAHDQGYNRCEDPT